MKFNAKKLLALVLVLAMTFALSAPAFAASKGDVMACTGNDVNVRKGPGTSYAKLGQLDKGDTVTFISKSGSWTKVEYNGQTAYVYSKYLKESSSSSSGSSSSGTLMYATTGVRVRSGPGTSYSQVGSLVADQAVTRTGKSGSWIQISYNGATAYVHGKYLTDVVPDGVDESTGSSASNQVVTKYATYIYRGPGQSYGVLYTANVNETLTTTGVVSGSFTQVNTAYGIGYVQTSAVTGATAGTTASIGNIVAATYLYKEAAYTSATYGIVLQAGTQVTRTGVVSSDGNWVQVTYGGYTGYVPQAALQAPSVNTGTNSAGTYVRYVIVTSTPVYNAQPAFALGTTGSLTVTGATSIGTLTYGTAVNCVAESNSFTKIIYNNTTYGYVLSSALSASLSGTTSTVTPSDPTHGTARVNSNSYIYSSTGYGLLGTLNAGTVVETTGVSGSYTQILYDGKIAYISTSALTILTTGTTTATGTATQGYVTVKKGALIVNMSTGAAETVPSDTLVILVSQDTSTSTAIIKDANNVQYKVHTAYLTTSGTTASGSYVTLKAGAMAWNTVTSSYESVTTDVKVLFVSQDTTAGTVTVKDANGVQYLVSSSYVVF